jgi:hypothetical protein
LELLNPMTIQHVGLGSARHILYMPSIDHSDFEAMLAPESTRLDPR